MTQIKLDATTCDIIVALHSYLDTCEDVVQWLKKKNRNLGGLAPVDLINAGKGKKVLNFVIEAIDCGEGEL